MLTIGCVSEAEGVAFSPQEVAALSDDDCLVLVQRYAGQAFGHEDYSYIAAGAQMRFDSASIARDADVLVKCAVDMEKDGFHLELMQGKTLICYADLSQDDVLNDRLVREQIATMSVAGMSQEERFKELRSVIGQLTQLKGMEYDRKLGQLRELASSRSQISVEVAK